VICGEKDGGTFLLLLSYLDDFVIEVVGVADSIEVAILHIGLVLLTLEWEAVKRLRGILIIGGVGVSLVEYDEVFLGKIDFCEIIDKHLIIDTPPIFLEIYNSRM
jgi:hypothetical protein